MIKDTNRTRKARTLLLAALAAGGAILLSGCVVRGGYSSGPVSFGVGWQSHAGHAFRCR